MTVHIIPMILVTIFFCGSIYFWQKQLQRKINKKHKKEITYANDRVKFIEEDHAKGRTLLKQVQEQLEKVSNVYTLVEPFDKKNREHIAMIAEVATNKAMRSLLILLREEAIHDVKQFGERAMGRVEAYDGVGAALDFYLAKARGNAKI